MVMVAALDDTLTARRHARSLNNRWARPASLDSLRHSIDPPRPAVLGGVELPRRGNLPPRAVGTLRTDDMHCELLRFAKGDALELEFSLPSHLIILLPDGISGECEWRNSERAGRSSSIPCNTVLFNPARDYLRLRKRSSRASCRLLLLTIAPRAVDRLFAGDVDAASVRLVQRIGMNDDNVRRTLLTFLEEIENPGSNSKSYSEILLALLLRQLIRCASSLARSERISYRKGGLASWRLKRALELLEGDLAGARPLTQIAHRLGLRSTSFSRGFKQSTGVSPHKYLLCHRISRAKEMMRDQTRSLTEIALDCGFGSPSHFSVVFRRIVGTSPREYRRSL